MSTFEPPYKAQTRSNFLPETSDKVDDRSIFYARNIVFRHKKSIYKKTHLCNALRSAFKIIVPT